MRAKSIIPTEADSQKTVVQFLRLRGLEGQFFACPNAGWLSCNFKLLNYWKSMGQSSGTPDLFLILPPPKAPGKVGTAIEMKRTGGGVVSEEQKAWLNFLDRMGWVTIVAHGADEAIKRLIALGY